jgi:hypothetical protein
MKIRKTKIFAIIFIGICFSNVIFCQERNLKLGKVSSADFTLPSTSLFDSSTQAIILADIGSTSFKGNSHGWVSYVYTRKTRIKILSKNALDVANVEIDLRQKDNGDDPDKLSDLSAITYNLENGKVIENGLAKDEVFTEKVSKRHLKKKFALPAVKEGSIIEYSYKITSFFYNAIPDWSFQDTRYPCLWSEFKITIPSLVGYKVARQGYNSFYIDETSEGNDNYQILDKGDASTGVPDRTLSVSSNTFSRRWVMKNIYPLKIENYTSNVAKYIDKLDFRLANIYNGETTKEYSNTWTQTTNELLEESDFGLPLDEENSWMNKILDVVLKGETDQLLQAKKIYQYIAANFTCTNHDNPYITSTLYDVEKKKTGTIGDINLLLVAMLRKMNISSNPVLLTTKEFGFSDAKNPMINKLNYVICRSWIKDRFYTLDASYSFLGFGNLPLNCYNGHARVIGRVDSSSLYFNADSINENNLTIIAIHNDEKNKSVLSGSLQHAPGLFESNNLRISIQKSGQNSYWDNLKTRYGGEIDIENGHIDSLLLPGEAIKIEYDFKMKTDPSIDIIYFNPTLFSTAFRENPFNANERKYPVEMNYPINEMYFFNMDIPEGYTVDELPKSAKVSYNGNEGVFQYQIEKSDNIIQLRSVVKLSKALYKASDYSSLREFFTYVVKKHQEQIVFRKKKA